MIDIEKYELLPIKLNKIGYLIDKYGYYCSNNIKNYENFTYQNKQTNIVKRIIRKNKNKSYNKTYSYFCRKKSSYLCDIFLDEFNNLNPSFYVDVNGNIQEYKRRIVNKSKTPKQEYYETIQWSRHSTKYWQSIRKQKGNVMLLLANSVKRKYQAKHKLKKIYYKNKIPNDLINNYIKLIDDEIHKVYSYNKAKYEIFKIWTN